MNSSSFIRLLQTECSSLKRTARARLDRRLRRRISASDIAQTTISQAIAQQDRLRRKGPDVIRKYLAKILRNELITQWRYHFFRKRSTSVEKYLEDDFLEPNMALLDHFTSPSNAAIHQEESRRLAERVHALPDDLHKVIVDRYINGRKVSEIAAEMNCSRDSVKRLIARALKRLRQDFH